MYRYELTEERNVAMTHLRRADHLYGGLHIAVLDGQVYLDYDRRCVPKGPALGPIAGAKVVFERLESTNRRRTGGQRSVDVLNATLFLGPIGILAGFSRKEDRGRITVQLSNGFTLERIRIGPLLRRAIVDARHMQAHENAQVASRV